MKGKKRAAGFLAAAVLAGTLLCSGIYAYLSAQAGQVNGRC
ncbi:hypothetical protein K040078D81_43970 [Blautia hominis]|uniref:Uncharacterized protein n=1 Tax=Blautia hominis TaxID=2025493 RepID=A0ABQ0BFN9_9FIRM